MLHWKTNKKPWIFEDATNFEITDMFVSCFFLFFLFLPSQVNTCSFAQNAEHMGSLQRAQ